MSMIMEKLLPGYKSEVDNINQERWEKLLLLFSDATIYQTWAYGKVRWGEDHLSHVVLKKNDRIIAISQARIITLPFINAGIAYIRWAPLWQSIGEQTNFEYFHQMIRALKNEYVNRRGLLLKVLINIIDNHENAYLFKDILQKEGFIEGDHSRKYRTFLIDLSPPQDLLRKNLKKKWRNRLKKSESNNLKIIDGVSDELYSTFMNVYIEMLNRKKFATFVDVKDFQAIQNNLPDELKMKVIICFSGSMPVSAALFSDLGNTGLCLLSGTNTYGMKLQSAYLIKWKTIEWMKDHGLRYLDLGGRDPEKNPDVDRFKRGMAGSDIYHFGEYSLCSTPLSSLFVYLVDCILKVINTVKLKVANYRV